jgi:hypothetical protein
VNLSATGSGDQTLRAFMYAYNNQPAELTNDNSPKFALSPTLAVATRNLSTYNHTAFDPDLDSLSYTWAEPLTNGPLSTPYPFAAGYSYTSPLPSTTQNPLNIPAVLNTSTGNITFKSLTQGAYVVVVKVSSFKCGVLVSEIFREMQIKIFANAILNTTPVVTYNQSPEISVNSLIANNGFFADTIQAGDSVHYVINVLDTDSVAGIYQMFSTSAYGDHFGAGFTDATSGCLISPCATLTPPPPFLDSISRTFSFDWRTQCAHASNGNGCLQHLRTFLFTLKSTDNYCPANGNSYLTMALSVRGPVIQISGSDLYISSPGSTFQWYLNGVAIAGATDSIYTPTIQGIYSVIAINGSGCAQLSNSLNRTFASVQNPISDKFNFNIGPNPIDKNGLSMLIYSPSSLQVNVQIVDQLGRLVYNQIINVSQGNQHLVLEPGVLSSGTYTIQMMHGNERINQKFVVN